MDGSITYRLPLVIWKLWSRGD